MNEANEKKFPDSALLQALMEAVSEAEQCASVAAQLVSAKVRTRSVDGLVCFFSIHLQVFIVCLSSVGTGKQVRANMWLS